jgi:CelD/BcsL family acetyltransferase involved in cellulose biosynthesis
MERGNVTFEASVDASEVAAVIDWMLQHKKEWLARTKKKNAWLATPEYRNFMVAIASKRQADGRVIVSTLKQGADIIAAAVSRLDRVHVEEVLTAYDPVYRKYSPSHILDEYLLKWAFNQGYRLVDLGLGEESYKDYWLPRKTELINYDVPLSRWGTVFILVQMAREYCAEIIGGPNRGTPMTT